MHCGPLTYCYFRSATASVLLFGVVNDPVQIAPRAHFSILVGGRRRNDKRAATVDGCQELLASSCSCCWAAASQTECSWCRWLTAPGSFSRRAADRQVTRCLPDPLAEIHLRKAQVSVSFVVCYTAVSKACRRPSNQLSIECPIVNT